MREALSPAAPDQSHQDQDDRHHQKDVDESSHRGATHETKQPEDDQDDGDGVEHSGLQDRIGISES